jgi:hypothetical protein
MKNTGFDRIELIHEALCRLIGAIKFAHIRSDWLTYRIPEVDYPSLSEEPIFIQKIAKKVAAHYKLSNTTFIVGFNSALKAAATVEIRNSDQIFIEYNHDGRLNMVDLWPTLAHEIAHIYLNRLGIEYSDTLRNEVLTDTATIILGFGHCYLSAQRKEAVGFYSSGTKYMKKTLGYLSPEEMGYILSIRDHIREENSFPLIYSEIGKNAYHKGRDRFENDQERRPYMRRSVLDRMLFKLGWQKASDLDCYIFPCLICKQRIRIPALRKKMIVRCSNCNASLTCFS